MLRVIDIDIMILCISMILGHLIPSEVAYVKRVRGQTQKIFLKMFFEWNPTQHQSSEKWLQVRLRHNIHGGLFVCLHAAASGCGQ